MRIFGALLIIAACYSTGVSLSKNESDKARAIDSLLKLLSYMKRRISAERTPIFDIFSSFSDDFLEKRGFLPILRSHRFESGNLWDTAVGTIPVNTETKSELMHFGMDLGLLNLDEQLRRIESCTDFLNAERTRLRESLPKKQKSIKSFWLLSGVLAVIILF